jgi:hypothetical protein
LEEQHGFVSSNAKPTKVVVLVGWLVPDNVADDERWVKEGSLSEKQRFLVISRIIFYLLRTQ